MPKGPVRLVQFGVVAVCTWFFALPQLPRAWGAVLMLRSVPWPLMALAGVLSFAALVAYAQLMRTTLVSEHPPGLWRTFGIITTSLGVSNVLPAGSALGSVVTFRLLEQAGVSKSRAATAMAVTSIGSAVVLNVLLGVGLIALLPTRGLASGVVVAAPVAVLLVALALLGRAVSHRSARLRRRLVRAGERFPRIVGDRGTRAVDCLADQFDVWRSEPERVRIALLWALLNWMIDVAALWITLLAVGVTVNPLIALVAFALANLAAMLPLTPGGLGIVELTLAATLVGFGAPAAPAALGIALYRLFNFWFPIPLAAISYAVSRLWAPCAIPVTHT